MSSCSTISIKKRCVSRYIRPITLNPWNTWHFLFSTYIWNQCLCFVVPYLEFYTNVIPQTLNLWFDIVDHCVCPKGVNISSSQFSWQTVPIIQTILQYSEANTNFKTTFQTTSRSRGVAISIPTTFINLWTNMWINHSIKASDHVFIIKLIKCLKTSDSFNPACFITFYRTKL